MEDYDIEDRANGIMTIVIVLWFICFLIYWICF